jgi:hypothetical protein
MLNDVPKKYDSTIPHNPMRIQTPRGIKKQFLRVVAGKPPI